MCLDVKWVFPRVSLKPIKVYKIMLINGNIITPYYNPEYSYYLSGLYTAESYAFAYTIYNLIHGCVDAGFFHSYKEIPQSWLERLESCDPSKISIVECTIPRFTLF